MTAAGCGKRGDPLPPLRPFPATAEGLAVRQVGDRIRLEWRAPVRNTDNTTEKLELAKVEVRRRIVDIPALIEAQTKIIEPEVEDDEGASSGDFPQAAEAVDPAEPEPALAPAETAPPASPDALVPAESGEIEEPTDRVPPEPQAPPTPILQIGEFAPDSRHVTTLESTEPGALVSFEETIDPSWIGLRIQYAVVYTNRSNRRGPRTTAVSIDPVAALEAPGEPTTETGDGFVTIRWDEPAPESYYSVFRRPEAAPRFPDTPLNAVPITDTEYVDRTAAFHTGWCYTIRTVPEPPAPTIEETLPVDSDTAADPDPTASPEPVPDASPDEAALDQEPGGPTVIVPEVPAVTNPVRVESVASPEVCLVPVDTFAPPAPTGLVAVRSGNNVLLTWAEVDRPDVVGYRVYRGLDDDGPFAPLSGDIIRVPSYTDSTVESGVTYFYVVTSVDDAPSPNESRHSELSEVTVNP